MIALGWCSDTLDDLRALDALRSSGRRLSGAIVGRALDEGAFTLPERPRRRRQLRPPGAVGRPPYTAVMDADRLDNARHDTSELIWKGEPNQFLPPEVAGLTPGRGARPGLR